ncbi:MAG: sugar phosphate isomerase/epimerase [Spirochaetaceae bacterium]|nr:sugar phosphate isomerase/epimerase [Spirochaetaceae bacterium]
MKTRFRLVLLSLTASAALAAADFRDHLGLSLFSLRAETRKSATGALDLVRSYGIKEVELSATGGLAPAQFGAELRSRGLVPVSSKVQYKFFEEDVAAVIRDAQTLGLKFLVVPSASIPGDREFTAALAREAAAKFNAWGEACKQAGIRLAYHTHGVEFRPTAAGNGETVFDVFVRETNPELVCFELDAFWVHYAGQDAVKLLRKYPNRWAMISIKDMRKNLATGFHTGRAPPGAKATVGQGQIDYGPILRAAQEIGVQHYFLGDDTSTPLESIPESLRYLRGLKL